MAANNSPRRVDVKSQPELRRTLRGLNSDLNSIVQKELGEIFASAVPQTTGDGYEECIGGTVDKAKYQDFWDAHGATWAWGSATSTFTLPDFRRRTLVGAGGSGTATLGNAMGNTGGAESITLTSAQSGIVAHSHTINETAHKHTITDPGHTHTATSTASAADHYHLITYVGIGGGGDGLFPGFGGETRVSGGVVDSGGTADTLDITVSTTVDSASTGITETATASTGITINNNTAADAASAHNNIQPSAVVRWYIYLGPARS